MTPGMPQPAGGPPQNSGGGSGPSTGFSSEGPKNCANCSENKNGFCQSAGVKADPAVPQEKKKPEGVDINPADKTYCDTEFKPLSGGANDQDDDDAGMMKAFQGGMRGGSGGGQ